MSAWGACQQRAAPTDVPASLRTAIRIGHRQTGQANHQRSRYAES